MADPFVRPTRRDALRAGLGAGGLGLLSSPWTGGPLLAKPPADDLRERLRRLAGHHPRLHFHGADRPKLRQRAEGSHQRYAQLLYDWVDQHRDWSPPLDVPDPQINEVMLETSAAFVTNAALAWVIGGREEDRLLARRWALEMCEIPRERTSEYALGPYLAGLARVYDWLYEQWSDQERRTLRDHLSRWTRWMYRASNPDTPGNRWWVGSQLHHDYWVAVGGMGEAALALVGEVDEAAQWAAWAKQQFDMIFDWIGEDGAWHEGPADWAYAMAALLRFHGAWRSVAGGSPHERPWLRRTAAYRLYHRLPDGTYIYLNDSFRSGRYNTGGSAASHLLRRLASLFEDSHAQWLAEREEEIDLHGGPSPVYQAPYGGSSYQARRTVYPHPGAICAAWNFLWYDPAVRAKAPEDLPRSRHFADHGLSILRSGWGEDAAVVSLACGPLGGRRCAERMRRGEKQRANSFTHAHADYNALTLYARGRYFIVPAGYARRSSRFHNTVAVNGANMLADASLPLRTEALVESEDFLYTVGDASAGFPKSVEVESYRRHVVLLDGALVVFDQLQLASRARRPWRDFAWRLHSDPTRHRLRTDGSTATWRGVDGDGPSLRLDVLTPEHFAWKQATLSARSGKPMLEGLTLLRPEWKSRRMHVLAVLSWRDRPPQPKLVRGERWRGVEWRDEPARPAIAFATEPIADPRAARGEESPSSMILFHLNPERPGAFHRYE